MFGIMRGMLRAGNSTTNENIERRNERSEEYLFLFSRSFIGLVRRYYCQGGSEGGGNLYFVERVLRWIFTPQ